MKSILVFLCLFLSLTANSFEIETTEGVESTPQKRDQVDGSIMNKNRLRNRLIRVRTDLMMGETHRATRRLDNIIASLGNNPNPGKTYSRVGIVYNRSRSDFRCNFNQEANAMKIAGDSARDFCYRAGNTSCRVVSNVITSNGHIGSINGTYYGWGCVASAVARGN